MKYFWLKTPFSEHLVPFRLNLIQFNQIVSQQFYYNQNSKIFAWRDWREEKSKLKKISRELKSSPQNEICTYGSQP